MKGFLLFQALKPFFLLAFLSGPYLLAVLAWQALPDGRLRRVLFRSWGRDSGPWISAPPVQRAETVLALPAPARCETGPLLLTHDAPFPPPRRE